MPSGKDRIPFRVKPMLATLVRKPFHTPGWIYEEKYDGYRILAYKEGHRVTLLSRNGNDRTATYASVARAIGELAARTLLLDGEVVAFDSHGISRFQLLQEGSAATTYAIFDCLYNSGRDLRGQPLERRRAAAEAAIDEGEGLMISRRLPEKLRYVGKVGTGFNEKTLASLYQKFKPLVQSKPALADPPRERDVTYLRPKLVAQISFQEWTSDRKLRQPVFLGLRDDKRAEEVQLPAKGTV